jgi:anti-anti-sigma factor
MQHSVSSEPGKVETANVEGAYHIRLTGECDLQVAPVLSQHVRALLERGEFRIIFDLERVTFMDSSVLGIFLDARRETIRAGGEVVLLCRPGSVRRLLSLLELDSILKICTPEEWRESTATLH